MDAVSQLDSIVRLFAQLGVEVRQEHLGGGGGGLCRIRGRRVVFIDLDADAATQLDRCAEALAAIPETGEVYISPDLRERMERLRNADERTQTHGTAESGP